MQNEQETLLYQGSPSQMVNFNKFAICGLMFLMAIIAPSLWKNIFSNYSNNKALYMLVSKIMFFIPLIYAPYLWLKVKNHKYVITTERFTEITGILSRQTNELELFRVKDMTFLEPLFSRIIGCGHIIMDTSDKSTPVITLRSIKNPRQVMDILRKNIMIMRTKKGVREIEM
jgi:uncharacterized membrane protein YdbT with pleckstrin-like domain